MYIYQVCVCLSKCVSIEQQAAILVAQTEGSLEYYHGLDREWYNADRTLIGERGVYRTNQKKKGKNERDATL